MHSGLVVGRELVAEVYKEEEVEFVEAGVLVETSEGIWVAGSSSFLEDSF